ncbi:penicillin-binding protein 1A [Litoreibacter arenae]|uniref:Penicillin-binding protein 1A n=1 Tax=Litoreibacter arenae DSM 19593 TaxID=1123360 RepID=S9QHY0_9RHOB|nr:PBP1A family penicillin-binding protein [Litoreibacter arenae]EPX79158.1 Penicillin-binding protein 1A [Litoreibacter arenae DSM 19593]
MLRAILSFFGSIFSLICIATFAVALLIGAIFFMYSRDLPDTDQLAQYSPPTISRIYSGQGALIDEFAQERRLFAPASEIPDLVKNAFISAEDKYFYTHKGYDPLGMAKAALDAAQGGRLRGASTITQQVMKNFLLSGDRSAERKIKELILASRIEGTLSKDKILELYLNEIFLGQNSFGVAAAAQTYFNKTLSELELEEAAYLAVLPKAPSRYHPVREEERAIGRRNFVLREMFENGYITEDEYKTAREKPLATVQSGTFADFKSDLPDRDYFTDEIRRQLSKDFGEDEFFGGGLTIRATVDRELQEEAAASLRRALEGYDRGGGVFHRVKTKIDAELLEGEAWKSALNDTVFPRDIAGWSAAVVLGFDGGDAIIGVEQTKEQGRISGSDVKWARPRLADGKLGRASSDADNLLDVGDVIHVRAEDDGTWSLRQVPQVQGGFMAMDVNTGRVLAMQGGFSYQASVFNRATQATRQPGSSFKPFVYAAALDSGFSPNTIIVDAPIEINTPQGLWRPKNASNRFYGPAPVRTGIEQSRNLMTIRLAQEIGMDTVAGYAERFGVYDDMNPFLSNALGAQETTLMKMVTAYAMFANGGERVEPTLVDRVQDRWGRTVYRHDKRECEDCQLASLEPDFAPTIKASRERVMDAITAYQLTSMMQGVVQRGTARKTVNLSVPTAGKTGTTNDAKDVWFVGFTSNIVAGCYIGYDRPRGLGRGAGGGGMCGPVFNRFMKEATAKYGGGEFEVPPGGYFVNIDRFTGAVLPANASGDHVVTEYFRDGEEPAYGLGAIIDGGFAMGSNLNLFSRGDDDVTAVREVTTSTGKKAVIPKRANFGTLSAGGLY